MHPLDGPRLKVQRAESEIDVLGQIDIAFMTESDFRVVRAELNPKTGNQVYRVRGDSRPPSDLGVSIGEITHNLRSALDGLIFQLALLNGAPASTRTTQFPIFLSRYDSKWRNVAGFHGKKGTSGKGRGMKMISPLPPDNQAIIMKLQPYEPGRGGRNNSLYLLTELNNADKHRLIQVAGAKTAGGPFVGWWTESDHIEYPFSLSKLKVLKDGSKFGEAPKGLHVGSKIYAFIAFSEGCDAAKGLSVRYTLRRIAAHVSEIIESFSPQFT